MTPKKIVAVVNPISGGIDKTELIQFLKTKSHQNKFTLHIFQTTGENDKENLRNLLEKINPDRIFIIGGDGSIKLVAEILTRPILLALFPAGSANGLAENLKLPLEIEKLYKVAMGNNYKELDAILINGELCLHLSDIGLNAALIKNYESGKIRGKLGYFIQSIPTLLETDLSFKFEISISEEKIRKEAFLVALTNVKKFGSGALINPDGKFNDGKFEILVFKKFNIPKILKTFSEDSQMNPDFVEIFSTSKAKITSNKKLPFQIDGEYRGNLKEVNAEISTQKFHFLAT